MSIKQQSVGKKDKERFQPHKQFHRMHFRENDMDFMFQWIMGSAVHGGASLGEGFSTAARITDMDGWAREWTELAKRVRARGEASLAAGHVVSGREALLRAAIYHRAVTAAARPADPVFTAAVASMRECFRKGSALLSPPMERIEIPFEGGMLPGYFRKAAPDGKPRPTLLMFGGAETFAEDLYYFIAPAAGSRGYNFMTVDLPGQGDLPSRGLFFRPDVETPMKPILDFALSRGDVDSQRVAAYGISAGGYMIPRAAVHDARIKACIANAMIFDMYEIFSGSSISRLKGLFKRYALRVKPFAMRMVELVAWRAGRDYDHLDEYVETTRGFRFDPADLSCPTLILVGEGEYANAKSRSQQDRAMERMPDPRNRLVIGPDNEGAASHCMGENLDLMGAFVFDWLDEVFAAE